MQIASENECALQEKYNIWLSEENFILCLRVWAIVEYTPFEKGNGNFGGSFILRASRMTGEPTPCRNKSGPKS
jgi:hypothetical protein